MKPNIMKKWVRALRSGKFKQCQGILKKYDKKGQAQHCCLGVLCELYNQEMKKNKKKMLSETISEFGYCILGNKKEDLPKNVMKWAGIYNSMGEFTTDDPVHGQYNLADLNDTGRRFKSIANIIEKKWENL